MMMIIPKDIKSPVKKKRNTNRRNRININNIYVQSTRKEKTPFRMKLGNIRVPWNSLQERKANNNVNNNNKDQDTSLWSQILLCYRFCRCTCCVRRFGFLFRRFFRLFGFLSCWLFFGCGWNCWAIVWSFVTGRVGCYVSWIYYFKAVCIAATSTSVVHQMGNGWQHSVWTRHW